jgi:hypothetical protein
MERVVIEPKKTMNNTATETSLVASVKRFFARKREDVVADLLIMTLVVASLSVILTNII